MGPTGRYTSWAPVAQEPGHPLAALNAETLGDGILRVYLGPKSRFGARYFALLLDRNGALSREAALSGLLNAGPLPSYNWIEVAETHRSLTFPDGSEADIGSEGLERLFALVFAILPPGGHIMVEYDSQQRTETARGLALNVPALATPLGELLFRLGFGAHFKDWQIAEGGSEGPRKLQAYKPPSPSDAARWRRRALEDMRAFLTRPAPASGVVAAARRRAQDLLEKLEAG